MVEEPVFIIYILAIKTIETNSLFMKMACSGIPTRICAWMMVAYRGLRKLTFTLVAVM